MRYYNYDEELFSVAKSACPNNCTTKVKFNDEKFRITSKLPDGTKMKFTRIDDRNQTARVNLQQKYFQAKAGHGGVYKSNIVYNEPVS